MHTRHRRGLRDGRRRETSERTQTTPRILQSPLADRCGILCRCDQQVDTINRTDLTNAAMPVRHKTPGEVVDWSTILDTVV